MPNKMSFLKPFIFLILITFVFGCSQTGNKFLDDELYCNVDADCIMGKLNVEDKCFPANKLFSSKMQATKNLITNCKGKDVKCVNNQCVLIDKKEEKLDKCEIDLDCAPGQCCHATTCVLKNEAPNCAGIMCTEECREGTLDCGGKCKCVNGECIAEFA